MYYSNLDDMFESFFNQQPGVFKTYKVVSTGTNSKSKNEDYDVNVVKDGAYLHFEVPGFNKNNLDVMIEGSELVLEGSRKYKMNGEEKVKEISRRIELNNLYDPSTVEATIEDGILTVYIPSYRKEAQKKKNKINLM